MKKTLLFICILIAQIDLFSQPIIFTQAPLALSTTQVRAPNGTTGHAFLRACSLVLGSELTGIPNGATISTFGFTMATGTGPLPVTGNFSVYLQNTTDITYSKSVLWNNILTGMTSVYANIMVIPNSPTTTSITLTLSSPFVYSGSGIYVAYDWISTSALNANQSSNSATYFAEGTALSPGGVSSLQNISAPESTLSVTAFRPSFLFGVDNNVANDLEIKGVEAPGKVAMTQAIPHTITTIVKNSGANPQSNITVSLNVTGANPFTTTQTISTLPAGSTATVTFPPYNPLVIGTNSIYVSVGADDNNSNNVIYYPQRVTCDVWARNPPAAVGSYTGGPLGFGTAAGIIATPYYNTTSSTLAALRLAISNDPDAVGKSVYGVILSGTGVVQATTNTLVITNSMLSTFQRFDFASPTTLGPINYYFGFAQIANATSYLPAGSLVWPYINPNHYVTTGINGGAYTPLPANYGYFGIEAVFETALNLSVINPTQMVCQGGVASFTAQGADTYVWSSAAGASLSVGASFSVNALTSTNYVVEGSLTNGCSAQSSVEISVLPSPTLSASVSPTIICLGESINVSVSGADSYTWTGTDINAVNENLSSITFSPSVTGIFNYSVSGTGSNNCVGNEVVAFTSDACLGISNSQAAANLNIFPNPGSGIFTISSTSQINTVSVYNLLGVLVKQFHTNEQHIELDIQNEANGVYRVDMISGSTRSVYKIIKE